jgi:AraC-like DNA-binding protein
VAGKKRVSLFGSDTPRSVRGMGWGESKGGEVSQAPGFGAANYVTRWRMQRARALLANQSLSVLDVPIQVGYGSQAAFNRACA